MIRDIHVQQLRDLVEQTERDLAGYRYLLGVAEQGARAGQVMPDPLMPAATPWPAPLSEPWPHAPEQVRPREPHPAAGREPYPADGGTPIFDGTLPPQQEAHLGTITSEHDAYAQTTRARDEEQKWQQA
ncbi:hypothetical protein [Nonomuraea sp. NPDC005650]|uniref:hypothetical protein n=1 Tax=Nonomuraea sp. NPDC005650 TaxID=3157045 RepID=UPI0033BB82D6